MTSKYTSMFGLLVVLMLVASFVVPANFINPAPVEADPGVMRWTQVDTPGKLPPGGDIANVAGILGSSIQDLAVGPDGMTMASVIQDDFNSALFPPWMQNGIRATTFMGIGWPYGAYTALRRAPTWAPALTPGVPFSTLQCYNIAIAPDDAKFWAVTTDGRVAGPATGPREVWVTKNAGATWECTGLEGNLTTALETIRTIDISIDYGGTRDMAVGTTSGTLGTGDIYVVKSSGFGGWMPQNIFVGALWPRALDFFAIDFSPTYSGDSGMAFVAADNTGSWYNICLRDIDANATINLAFGGNAVEVKDASWPVGNETNWATLNKADLELPSDFSATAVSLRRAYVSLDGYNGGAAKAVGMWDGIFRIDDQTIYTLMDTHNDFAKSIYSIAYFGTYASGKLLAGERMGYPCTATVPTWFTDSPTTCPIPCWYPALKPTTGGILGGTCAVGAHDGNGAAIVAWNPQGTMAYAVTGQNPVLTGAGWFLPYMVPAVPNMEGAFAISRNNGETWNQLWMINTTIDWINDVAPSPDCTTVYFASSNLGWGVPPVCNEFDSVWRSSTNSAVTAPLPGLPIGSYWERVFTHTTSVDCTLQQSDLPILRLPPYCDDLPDGQLLGWAARGTRAQAWSPDYGDYWAMITPRWEIQDFAFESSKVMYNLMGTPFLGPLIGGTVTGLPLVQKLPFTGTAWSTLLPDVDTNLTDTHTIVAYPEGNVLVGAGWGTNVAMAAAVSTNFATDTPSFNSLWSLSGGATNDHGDVHTCFDSNYGKNGLVYIADSFRAIGIFDTPFPKNTWTPTTGSVYRNKVPTAARWVEMDMMEPTNGAIGTTNQTVFAAPPVAVGNAFAKEGLFGIVNAFTGANGQQALYVASDNVTFGNQNSVVFRTLWPQDGMPKPGIVWDALMVYAPVTASRVNFTLEPSSLKICGCCSLDTDSTLYAVDDEEGGQYGAVPGYDPLIGQQGNMWTYTDCLAKKGPVLITEDKALIGCDPVSGRAQEVNLCWEQLCVATGYDIEIAKDTDFSIKVIDWVGMGNADTSAPGPFGFVPANRLKPCAFVPAGGQALLGVAASELAAWGNLECGHTYQWRVMARWSATGEIARSPWSETRSFTIKAGLPVTTPYYGPQLLAPNNGCVGCPTAPASFSWSPFKETTKYKFVLAKDAAMTQVVKEAEVTTTAFEYDGTLDYSTNYFWRVMALEPAPSDWSATFSFQTEGAPPPAPAPEKAPGTPFWVWVIIAIGAILVIVTLVLIFKTRRT